MEHAERQNLLKETFHFACRCDLCILPPAQLEESDLRLSKIQSIDDALGDSGDAPSHYDAGLHLVRTMLQLLEEEGIWDAGVPRAYYDAFQIAIANGDEARAKIFAERSYAARVIIEGDDSPEAAKLKQLADRPTQHRLYKAYVESQQGISPPQEMDGLEFDDWLWREKEWPKHLATSNVNNPWDGFGEDLYQYSQSLSDERSESFDSLSTSSIRRALFRSLNRP